MKEYYLMLLAWLPLTLFIYSINITPTHSMPPLRKITALHHFATMVSIDKKDDVETFYYKQVLDHFNYLPESYNTFDQRYFINFKYWGGANSSAPILVYLGLEAALDGMPESEGFMNENACAFKALLVFIEHRYYGKSIPFGSSEEAFKNASTTGYLNSAQALADYAEVLIHIKKTLQAEDSPVVVVGASYGGMLASWFRLKYPHLAIGALASSAPIRYIDDIIQPNACYDVVSRDFKEASETCYKTICDSWYEIDKIASRPNGLSILSERFNTCNPLNQSLELSSYLEDMYAYAAQYNMPPEYPVNMICNAIDQASHGHNIIDKIYSGVVAFYGNHTCHIHHSTSKKDDGWGWQTCTEMVMPYGKGNDSMFPLDPFDLKNYTKNCEKIYGVSPRPHWISSYYGGHDIKLVLKRFSSNIIFSNGLKDPYSSGGILSDLSKSLVAITTINGSHCLDLRPSSEDDPEWLIKQRKKEVRIIKGWIKQYYSDLAAFHRIHK